MSMYSNIIQEKEQKQQNERQSNYKNNGRRLSLGLLVEFWIPKETTMNERKSIQR